MIADTEEVSTLLILISLVTFIIYAAALPILFDQVFYYPGWTLGLAGLLFYGYFLIEIGLLKVFYQFSNSSIVERRIQLRHQQEEVQIMQDIED